MPPNSPAAPDPPSPSAERARTPLGSALLRSIPGGYDITGLPLQVPPLPAESAPSWLRRLADRYTLTPQQILRVLGDEGRPTTLAALHAHIERNAAGITQHLRIPEDDLENLCCAPALDTLTAGYLQLYHHRAWQPSPASRYCPECLTQEPTAWAAAWRNPYTVICPTHAAILHDLCPSCGQRPFATMSWLGQVAEPWICPSRRPAPRGRFGRPKRGVRPFCGHDLRTVTRQPATDDRRPDPGPTL
ncbi:TniQ family protein, partial [Mobilicoccus pelagius]